MEAPPSQGDEGVSESQLAPRLPLRYLFVSTPVGIGLSYTGKIRPKERQEARGALRIERNKKPTFGEGNTMASGCVPVLPSLHIRTENQGAS